MTVLRDGHNIVTRSLSTLTRLELVCFMGSLLSLRDPHDAIAATVMGGTFLAGGQGSVFPTLVGF